MPKDKVRKTNSGCSFSEKLVSFASATACGVCNLILSCVFFRHGWQSNPGTASFPAPPTNRCKTIELLLFHGRNPFGPSRGFHLLNNICMSLLLFFVVLFLFFFLSAIKKGRKSFADDRDWCSSLDHCYAEEEGDAQLRLSNESDRY